MYAIRSYYVPKTTNRGETSATKPRKPPQKPYKNRPIIQVL